MPSTGDKLKAIHRAESKRRRERVRQWIFGIKESTPCADCKLSYAHYVMDFDHRPGVEKVSSISELLHGNFSQKKLRVELEKCDVVCANCHRERTQSRLGKSNAGFFKF